MILSETLFRHIKLNSVCFGHNTMLSTYATDSGSFQFCRLLISFPAFLAKRFLLFALQVMLLTILYKLMISVLMYCCTAVTTLSLWFAFFYQCPRRLLLPIFPSYSILFVSLFSVFVLAFGFLRISFCFSTKQQSTSSVFFIPLSHTSIFAFHFGNNSIVNYTRNRYKRIVYSILTKAHIHMCCIYSNVLKFLRFFLVAPLFMQ